MSGKTILYVEDNELNRRLVRDLLKRTTYRLIEAYDGEAGITTALAERPDLILMDIQLPKVSGLDVVRRLRAEASMASQEISNWTAATLDQRSLRVIGQKKMASRTFWRAACVGPEVVLVVITISS